MEGGFKPIPSFVTLMRWKYRSVDAVKKLITDPFLDSGSDARRLWEIVPAKAWLKVKKTECWSYSKSPGAQGKFTRTSRLLSSPGGGVSGRDPPKWGQGYPPDPKKVPKKTSFK